ncbi:hypothetical protein G6O67_006398 [Ophiocordyceps sinensis]|uniref:Terpene synthase n=1 Tax=Ophiocordyceps sinensis TaxID=72228 RepID=A0A8H4LVZ6_9HYPO|nr:hypothetical protein G6O67_006398 [Ophiocordyceps sinensis]
MGAAFTPSDLRPAFANWEQGVSPHHGKLIPVVNAQLEKFCSDKKAVDKGKAIGFALLASSLYPKAAYPVVETMALYAIWNFFWDDEVDRALDPDAPDDIAADVAAADMYRAQSIAYIRHQLGLGDAAETSEPVPPTLMCSSFVTVAPSITRHCNGRQAERLCASLELFVAATGWEQEARLSGRMPTEEEYWQWRIGTTSVDAMLDLADIMNGVVLPSQVLESHQVGVMRMEIIKNTVYVNDLFSLRKEMQDDTLMNLVPITMQQQSLDLNSAAQQIVSKLYESIETFDCAAEALRKSTAQHFGAEAVAELGCLIEAYQTIATGVFSWTLQSSRYGVAECKKEHGRYDITL